MTESTTDEVLAAPAFLHVTTQDPAHKDNIAKRAAVFQQIWANNAWACPETRSGTGSSMAETAQMRGRLSEVLRFLDIRILADAPCGELNWTKEILDQLQLYLGFDIVPEIVANARTHFQDRKHCFFSVLDIVTECLPKVDAILCRDCLGHMPLETALTALQRFRASGSRYLIATTFLSQTNQVIPDGHWYPINLCAAPFNLKPPIILIPEVTGASKMLGVWEINDLPGPQHG